MFENMIKKTEYKATNKDLIKSRVDLDNKRNNYISIIQYVFKNEVLGNNKQFGKDKIIKMAIDNLIKDLDALGSESKQLEYLKLLYKDAMF